VLCAGLLRQPLFELPCVDALSFMACVQPAAVVGQQRWITVGANSFAKDVSIDLFLLAVLTSRE
jgi:hypothetical protein